MQKRLEEGRDGQAYNGFRVSPPEKRLCALRLCTRWRLLQEKVNTRAPLSILLLQKTKFQICCIFSWKFIINFYSKKRKLIVFELTKAAVFKNQGRGEKIKLKHLVDLKHPPTPVLPSPPKTEEKAVISKAPFCMICAWGEIMVELWATETLLRSLTLKLST